MYNSFSTSALHWERLTFRSGRFTPVIIEYEAGCGRCAEEIIYFPYQDSSPGPSNLKPSHILTTLLWFRHLSY